MIQAPILLFPDAWFLVGVVEHIAPQIPVLIPDRIPLLAFFVTIADNFSIVSVDHEHGYEELV
jgi:hypothetical protein